MPELASVPDDQPEQLAIDDFEGLVVHRYRIEGGPVGNFASLDENGQPLKLLDEDVVLIQCEMKVDYLKFKGGSTTPRDRIHPVKVIEGSQQIVGVRRAER